MNTVYEVMLLLPANQSEKAIKKDLAEIAKDLESRGASIVKTEEWGTRDMTYPVKGHEQGFYAYMHVQADTESIANIKKEYNLNEKILRYLITALPENFQAKKDGHVVEIIEDIVNFGEERAKKTSSQPIPNPDKNNKIGAKGKKDLPKKDAKDQKIANILEK